MQVFYNNQSQKFQPYKYIINDSHSGYQHIYQEIIGLTKRLYIQIYRKPSIALAGIIQPLLWLILFSALFQNIPTTLFLNNIKYVDFLGPGILVFTAFTGSINAGLPIMFDREFGFLNRILVSPIQNRYALIISSLISIWTITITQIIVIISCNIILFQQIHAASYLPQIIVLTTLIIINVANISICIAFILPGHIELLAAILIINLPVLFSSTALAPLQFMPYWLQIITCINPITHVIEILRYLYLNNDINYHYIIINTIWINLDIWHSLLLLCFMNIMSFFLVNNIVQQKYE